MVLTNVAQNSFVMHIKDDESCLFEHAVPKSDKTLLDVPTSTDGQNAVFDFYLDVYFFNDCQLKSQSYRVLPRLASVTCVCIVFSDWSITVLRVIGVFYC